MCPGGEAKMGVEMAEAVVVGYPGSRAAPVSARELDSVSSSMQVESFAGPALPHPNFQEPGGYSHFLCDIDMPDH